MDATRLEMIAAASQAGRDAAVAAAHQTRPGVVMAIDPTNTTALVQADGPTTVDGSGEDSGPHGAAVVAPVTLRIGDRVMLLYTGAVCFVIGRRQGDWERWHVIGDDGEPTFNNAWGHAAGTFPLGQNGPAQAAFTMRSGRVELRGRAERSTGGAGIYNLPEYAWPENDLLLAAEGALGAFINISVDSVTGLISVGSGNFVVFDGISFLARIQQPD